MCGVLVCESHPEVMLHFENNHSGKVDKMMDARENDCYILVFRSARLCDINTVTTRKVSSNIDSRSG